MMKNILQPIYTEGRRSMRWDRSSFHTQQENEEQAPDVVRGVHPRQMYYPRDWVGIELEQTSRVSARPHLRIGRPHWLHEQMHRSISEGLVGMTDYAVVESQHSSLPMGLLLVSARGQWYVVLLTLPSGERVWVQEGSTIAPAPPLLARRESGEYLAARRMPVNPLLESGRKPSRRTTTALHAPSVAISQRASDLVYIEDVETRTIQWSGYLLVSRNNTSMERLRRLGGSQWVVNEVLMHAWATLNLGSSDCDGVSDVEVFRLPSGVLLFGAASHCTTTTADVPYVESELIMLLMRSPASVHAVLGTREGGV